VALAILAALIVLSPWAFGAVHPRAVQAVALVSLLVSLAAARAAVSEEAGTRTWPRVAPRPLRVLLLALLALACLQLLPLPAPLLRVLAPGPSFVRHPSEPLAGAVLGGGWRPLSLFPEATLRWLALATGLVSLAIAAAPALGRRRPAWRAALALVGGGLAVALYGLVARLAFGEKLYGVLAVPTIAPFGPFVSKNHFAGYMELAACLAVGLAAGLADEARQGPGRLSWLDSRRSYWVVTAWGGAAVLVLAVPASLSRGGVVSLTAGLVTFAALRLFAGRERPKRGLVAAGVTALLVLGLAVAALLPQEARARVGTLVTHDRGGPDPFRIGVWHDSLQLAASSAFLGSGMGAYEDALPRFKTGAGAHRVEHAENDWLELLCEGGLVGAGCVLAAFVTLVLVGLRRIRDEPHRLHRGLRSGALAGLTAVAVHSAVDFNLRIPSNALLAAGLLAFLLAPADGAPGEGPRARGRLGRWLFVLLLAGVSALAAVVPWTPRRFDTERLLRARAGVGPAPELRRRALEADAAAHLRARPADAQAWVALAWLRLPTSPGEAAALAAWGRGLDPRHETLGQAAERVIAAASRGARP
jgi:O-antigen ligase